MHPLWQPVFQTTYGSDEGSPGFASPAEEAHAAVGGSVVAPLVDQGVIHVTGAHAASFLHAQVSNAVTDLKPPETRLAAWCSPKGRTLALFRLVPVDDGFLVLLDRGLVAPTLKRLRMFVLRSAVTIADVSDDFAAVGVSGPAATGLLAEGVGDPPSKADRFTRAGDLAIARLPSPQARFILMGPGDQVLPQWRFLARGLVPVGPAAWRLLAIQDGRPEITELTRDTLVPQMLNLEPLGGISYDKGCYPGQEVVARMHYLGRLKRRLYRLRISTDTAPSPGAELDNDAGSVVSAATDGHAIEALAVLRIDAAEAGGLTWQGHPATLMDLPYSMEP